jgi:hypothetical protein
MLSQFWGDLLANLLADLAAGAALGVLFAYVVDSKLRLRERVEQDRETRRERIDRAMTYLSLLHSEIEGIVAMVPNQVATVKMQEHGMAVPIVTPVWDLLAQSGELVPLVNPRVLQQTAWFYEQIGYAKHIQDFLERSWLVPEDSVAHIDHKRRETRDKVAGLLKTAETSGRELLQAIDAEGARLRDRLQPVG